jgi:predicted DNA-binding transcriptional regulator AlpA
MTPEESDYLGGAALARMLGISTMTLWRWERDPELGFPLPTVIRERKYWSRAAVVKWMHGMAVGKVTRRRASGV